MQRPALKAILTFIGAITLLLGAALPAWAADSVTLTLIRHAESFGNVPGAGIDTKVPGPVLTPLGEQQAADIAPGLALAGFDGIYYSNMIRTYQTAQPLMALQPTWSTQELAGFREISAGIFEGQPISSGLGRIGYFLIPLTWALGLRSLPIPLGEGGNEFDARYSGAVATVIANGDTEPVIFSHGAAIMAWSVMNVDNPDIGLLLSHPLGNTEQVVVTGNPTDGWMMQSYAGIPVSQNPSLLTQLFVNTRDLIVAPQTAAYNVVAAIGTLNLQNIVVAVADGVVSVIKAGVGFVVNSATDIVNAIVGVLPRTDRAPASAVTQQTPARLKARVAATAVSAAAVGRGHRTQPAAAAAATAKRSGEGPGLKEAGSSRRSAQKAA
ncbi:MAG: histidine phosphatase family protein [Mycobacterium sp.]